VFVRIILTVLDLVLFVLFRNSKAAMFSANGLARWRYLVTLVGSPTLIKFCCNCYAIVLS